MFKIQNHKNKLIFVSVICALLAIFFFDVLFQGKTFKVTSTNPQALISGPYGQENNKPKHFTIFTSDVSLNEEPTLEFIKQSLKKGILPLWNPHLACGHPLIGMIQVGIFYPLNLLYYLLPSIHGWDALIFARMFFAGLFMFWFMRTLKYSALPSYCAAILFMLGRPSVTIHQWMINVDILTPLILLLIERLMNRQDTRSISLLSLAVGLSCFAGHPEHLVLVHYLALLYFIFRLFQKPRPSLKIVIPQFIVAYALGIGVSSIVIFPFIQNWLTEFWHTHPENMGLVSEFAGIRKFQIAMLFPNFFQKVPLDINFNPSSWWGAEGILPMALAWLGMLGKQKKKLNWLFAPIAIILIIKIFYNIPPIKWIGYIPPLNLIRFNNHSVHAFHFVLSALAGMGLHTIFAGKKILQKYLFLAVPCFIYLMLSLKDYYVSSYKNSAIDSSIFSSIILFTTLCSILLFTFKVFNKRWTAISLICILCFELFSYVPRGRADKFDSFPETPYINFIKNSSPRSRSYGIYWTLYPNSAAGHQIDDFGIFYGLLSKRYVGFVNNFLIPDYFKKDFTRMAFWVFPVTFLPRAIPFTDMLNIRYTVAPKSIHRLINPEARRSLINPVYNDEVFIYNSHSVLPRSFVVHRAIFEPNSEKTIPLMYANSKNFRSVAILNSESSQSILNQLKGTPNISNTFVNITKYTPNYVRLEVDMSYPGFVVLGDTFHPDWKATIDKEETDIFVTNYLIRSVFVPKGKHTIEYKFVPIWFYRGGVVSLLLFLVILILFWRGRLIKSKKSY